MPPVDPRQAHQQPRDPVGHPDPPAHPERLPLPVLGRQRPGTLESLEEVLDVLNKNEDNIDDSLRLMAPFYRVFANTLGSGPWFDTYIQNFPLAVPDLADGGGVG